MGCSSIGYLRNFTHTFVITSLLLLIHHFNLKLWSCAINCTFNLIFTFSYTSMVFLALSVVERGIVNHMSHFTWVLPKARKELVLEDTVENSSDT